MVSHLSGELALKVGAILSAIALVPPLVLDDREYPGWPMIGLGIAVSGALGACGVAMLRRGSHSAPRLTSMRYQVISAAFLLVAACLFVMEAWRLSPGASGFTRV